MASRSGFTLLEMSIVLVLIGVIVGGSITIFTASLQKRQLEETQAKLQAIQATLYNYRVAFNRLPCASDARLALTDVNFGVEAANPGSCTGGVPDAVYISGSNMRQGGVPTQTLRLPDDYAIDGWGRRIKYIVDVPSTALGAFATIPYPDPSGGRLAVFSTYDYPAGVNRTLLTNLAAYVLISFGPDGNGAYPRTGGGTPIGAGTLNYDELANCNCAWNGSSNGGRTYDNSVYIQKAPTTDYTNRLNSFGDVVVYGTRATLTLPSEQ